MRIKRTTPRSGVARRTRLLAVTTGPLDTPALDHLLTAALTRAGLSAPRIAVRTVSRIDRDAASGKLRRFVPLIPDR